MVVFAGRNEKYHELYFLLSQFFSDFSFLGKKRQSSAKNAIADEQIVGQNDLHRVLCLYGSSDVAWLVNAVKRASTRIMRINVLRLLCIFVCYLSDRRKNLFHEVSALSLGDWNFWSRVGSEIFVIACMRETNVTIGYRRRFHFYYRTLDIWENIQLNNSRRKKWFEEVSKQK